MKEIIENINRVFESRVRLGIMSILMVNPKVDYNSLKKLLDLTDGNLASHLNALMRYDYIKVYKTFIGKKPNTSYTATVKGRKAFREHLDAVEKLIKQNTK